MSDCAAEYCTQQLRQVLRKHKVDEILHSNEHQQFQNGRAEKLDDSISRKIRSMLLQSQMPPEFWGAVVVFSTDIYNSHLITALAWNHLTITDMANSPNSHFSKLLVALLLCIGAEI